MKKLFFCIFILTSCSLRKDIIVSYLYDGVETPISIELKEFDSNFHNYKVDVFYIPKNVFDSIYYGFKKTNDKKEDGLNARFSVKIGNAKYYINRWFDVVNIHHDSVSVDSRVIYLLRQYSGFYNYIESEDLVSPDIELYGIPNDYQYMQPSKKKGKKVILYPQK